MTETSKVIFEESKSVKAVEYSPAELELMVEFRTGSKYKYAGVDADTYHRLLVTNSVGKFMAEEIKPNFIATKLEEAVDLSNPDRWTFPTEKKVGTRLNKPTGAKSRLGKPKKVEILPTPPWPFPTGKKP